MTDVNYFWHKAVYLFTSNYGKGTIKKSSRFYYKVVFFGDEQFTKLLSSLPDPGLKITKQ